MIVTYTGLNMAEYLPTVTADSTAVTVNLYHSLIKLANENY